MADTHSIYLVPKLPQKPQPLNSADIAAEVLKTVRECQGALSDFQEYQEHLTRQLSAHLSSLEMVALRAIARKARQS